MDMEKFAEAVLRKIREKADGRLNAWTVETQKNNGARRMGITLAPESGGSAPCFYLESYWQAYQTGGKMLPEIAGEIYQDLLEYQDCMPKIDTTDFLYWENIKSHIYARLVNAEKNRELLREVPCRGFLDLAVVYYVRVPVCGTRIGTILVNNCHMALWEQDEESLYRTAVTNMRMDGMPDFRDMGSILKDTASEITGTWENEDIFPATDMYVLINRFRKFGAAEILNKDALKVIAGKIGDGYVILPCSVHEVIILPSRRQEEYPALAGMVGEINAVYVEQEEQLSDHIYAYRQNGHGELQLVA